MKNFILMCATLTFTTCMLNACALPELIGGMSQNSEYQKQVEIPAEYEGLAGKSVAVLVDVNMAMLYEHPNLQREVAYGIARALQNRAADKLPGIKVVSPQQTLAWQFNLPSWNLMRYSEMAQALQAERVIVIDISEYRLNPPGNRYEWDGVFSANIRVVAADENTFDPDTPEEFAITAKFPGKTIPWESERSSKIQQGLMLKFFQQTAWLFYEHIEPKYPDKYRAELGQ